MLYIFLRSITKCLLLIFIESSVITWGEMRKSDIPGRSGNLQGSSFMIDKVLKVTTKEKGRGLQDHYNIFRIHGHIVKDIGPNKNLFWFTSNPFDLGAFSSSHMHTKLSSITSLDNHIIILFRMQGLRQNVGQTKINKHIDILSYL